MKKSKDISRLLASLAVFRELYDSKKDIYGIIAEFLREVIIEKAKHKFNLAEITRIVNSYYYFNLPESVVMSSLAQLEFINKSNGYFIVNNFAQVKTSGIIEKQKKILHNNQNLINQLIKFIEKQTKKRLNINQQGKVVESFCSFILDGLDNQDYFKQISAFIINNEGNNEFVKQLGIIKEGVILYSGIRYSSDKIDVGVWDTDLTIYIDTEILFYLAGYDGELYKTIVSEFLSYVREINQNKSKKLIKLLYFNEVFEEIDVFFHKAEEIVTGADKLDPSRTAMSSIVNGCHSASDIVVKRTLFFDLLEKNEIFEDDYSDYYLPENHKFNISEKSTIESISKSLYINDIEDHLTFLNYINIHRGDAKNNNFENIGYILLSGNSITQRVGWHDEIKKYGNVPLVTNLTFLTNKLWFKLNKGFGPSNYPKSFDVITKAQIILSTQLNDSVRIQYESLQKKFSNDDLTEKQAASIIGNLRTKTLKPEDIGKDNLPNVLMSISEKNIELYIHEQEYFRSKAKDEEKKNIQLMKKYKNSKATILSNTLSAKQALLEEKRNSISILNNQKIPIDKIIAKSYRNFKIIIGSGIALYYLIIFLLIIQFGWNKVEPLTWILGVALPIIVSTIYMLIYEKTINPKKIFNNKKISIQKKKYYLFNIDTDQLKKLIRAKEVLKNEIAELETEDV